MSIDALREILVRLNVSANALAVVGAALDARASGNALDLIIRPHVDEVLAAMGASEALEGISPAEIRSLLGEIRVYTLTNAKLLFAASRSAGWAHTDPEILEAAGDVSANFPWALMTTVASKLDGLEQRLSSSGAAFLEVGAGVAVMAVEMARLWPTLRVVGIDPWAPALAIARERVRVAGLDARIELRGQRGEDLPDVDAFDLAWIASVFVPELAIRPVLQRVRRALRPGGWLLFPTLRPTGDRLSDALATLRTAMFGGWITTPERVETLLTDEGFIEVHTMQAPPHTLAATIAGRRPRYGS